MTEPVSVTLKGVSLITLAAAVFGPNVGPYVVIILGAIGGGLWPLSTAALNTRREGAWLMLRCVLTAVVLTALIAGLLGPYFDVPVTELYAAIAFVIGALGNKWLDIFESIKTRLQGAIENSGAGKP